MVRSVIKEWEWKITNIRTEMVFINIFRDRYSPGSVGDAASVCGLQSRGLCRIRAHAGSRGAPLWCQRRSRGTPGSAEGLVAVLNPDFTLFLSPWHVLHWQCVSRWTILSPCIFLGPVCSQSCPPATYKSSLVGFFFVVCLFSKGKKKKPKYLN